MLPRTGSQHGGTKKIFSLFTFMVCRQNLFVDKYFVNSENGYWLVGDKYQNVGGFKSSDVDLDDVPSDGWLYNDGTKWNAKDQTITVKGQK